MRSTCPFHLCLIPLALVAIAAASPPSATYFTDSTSRLGSPQPCADTQEGCYSNYALLIDLDQDFDLDLVFANGGAYYEPGDPAPFAAYLNDGNGTFSECGSALFGGFEGRLRQVAAGDVDGDGDIDLYLPDAYALQPDALFINDGENPPHFSEEGQLRLPLTSRAGGARFGDMDGDGDLDLMLTDWGADPPHSPGTARLYLNDGSGVFEEKLDAVAQDTSSIGTGPVDVDLFDADGDFDLDLLLASREGDSLLFFNDGSGHLVDANDRLPPQPGPYVYGPDACDVDGDGDLDLWLDNGATILREQLLINDGNGLFRDESRARIPGINNRSSDDNEVQCIDIDQDGDFDAVIASLSGTERILINDGSGHFTFLSNGFPRISDSTLGLDLGDVNGDGRLDAITAQGESGSFLNRLYLGTAQQMLDTQAPGFRAVEQAIAGPSGHAVVRFAVADGATGDVGPRLIEASLHLGDGSIVSARFIGGDLFRAVLEPPVSGAISYRACATDWAGNQACSGTYSAGSGVAPAAFSASKIEPQRLAPH